jgi:hypothetical protein
MSLAWLLPSAATKLRAAAGEGSSTSLDAFS